MRITCSLPHKFAPFLLSEVLGGHGRLVAWRSSTFLRGVEPPRGGDGDIESDLRVGASGHVGVFEGWVWAKGQIEGAEARQIGDNSLGFDFRFGSFGNISS